MSLCLLCEGAFFTVVNNFLCVLQLVPDPDERMKAVEGPSTFWVVLWGRI